MKTKAPLLLPFALFLALAVTACPSSDDGPGASAPAGSPGSSSSSGSPDGNAGSGGKGAGTARSCIFAKKSTMYCPDAGPTDIGGDPTPGCRDSVCGIEAEDYVSDGCRFTTLYLDQREFAGTCDDYKRAKAEGRIASNGDSCELTQEEPACAACAQKACCDELAACTDPDACMASVRCHYDCFRYLEPEMELIRFCGHPEAPPARLAGGTDVQANAQVLFPRIQGPGRRPGPPKRQEHPADRQGSRPDRDVPSRLAQGRRRAHAGRPAAGGEGACGAESVGRTRSPPPRSEAAADGARNSKKHAGTLAFASAMPPRRGGQDGDEARNAPGRQRLFGAPPPAWVPHLVSVRSWASGRVGQTHDRAQA